MNDFKKYVWASINDIDSKLSTTSAIEYNGTDWFRKENSLSPKWYVYGNSAQGLLAILSGYDTQNQFLEEWLPSSGSCSTIVQIITNNDVALSSEDYKHYKRRKTYDIKDHLGNVRLSFTDMRGRIQTH